MAGGPKSSVSLTARRRPMAPGGPPDVKPLARGTGRHGKLAAESDDGAQSAAVVQTHQTRATETIELKRTNPIRRMPGACRLQSMRFKQLRTALCRSGGYGRDIGRI